MIQNVVLFQGNNTANETGLWETSGIAAGTFELAPITGASASGLSPSNLTNFEGEALFEGRDTAGHFGLWVTSGTAAGTHELTGITGAAASGLSPNNLTVYNGQVVFNGLDTGGKAGLWTTSGTAASTHEVTGIGNTNTTTGLNPSRLHKLQWRAFVQWRRRRRQGRVVEDERDGDRHDGSDRRVGGDGGLNPSDLTVFGGEVLFSGDERERRRRIVADERHGRRNARRYPSPGRTLLASLQAGLTVLNGEVLFSGVDTAGHNGLWETNGTTTTELAVVGADPTLGLTPRFLTAFNGEVLFNGLDSSGLFGLWETDGTAGGTHELTGIVGAPTTGAGLDPTGFELFNGEVLFSGKDLSGHNQLWQTDGTAGGTHEITGVAGVSSSGLGPFDLTSATLGTITNEILWQNTNGQAAVWGIERRPPRRRRDREPQSRVELESDRNRRFRRRRPFRHPVAEHERSGRDLGNERDHPDRRRSRDAPIPGRAGERSEPATSMTTAFPTSCGRTPMGRPRSGT